MQYQNLIQAELQEAANVLQAVIQDKFLLEAVEHAAETITTSFKQKGKVISCGNGGSHCDAMHFAEELTGRFRNDRKAFPAIAISDPSHISCVGNDFGYQAIFSRYVEALGQPNDVLLAISTSGNSENIIHAAKAAKTREMKVIALTGKDGGKLASLVDLEIRVPAHRFADRVQEIHIKVIHILILLIEQMMDSKA